MTKIPWVRNPDGTPGYTWNPITGCLNGCPYCYARKLANTRLKERYLHGFPDFGIIADRDYQGGLDDPFYPRIWPTKISIPIHRRKPTGYFVCDMSDLFGIGVPEQWTSAVLETIRKCPQHRFYLLTKQPQELAKFSPFPPNCFVMVSATDAKMLIRGGEYLSEIGAKVKGFSIEPLLSWEHGAPGFIATMLKRWGISWIILGEQTKPIVHPPADAVEEIISAADKARIPVFIKEPLASYYGGPERQEMPIVSSSIQEIK